MQEARRALGLFSFMVVVVSSFLALPPAVSAGEWGVGTATSPSADWVPSAAEEAPWYAFEYAGDGSEIRVNFQATPPGSAGFVVWTLEQIQR